MARFLSTVASGIALLALTTSAPVGATPKRHKVATSRHAYRQPPRYAGSPYYQGPALYYGGYPQPLYAPTPAYGYYGRYPGEAVLRATARAQSEPGVTRELAPDAVQTATGGPVGGVPGFSGGGGR